MGLNFKHKKIKMHESLMMNTFPSMLQCAGGLLQLKLLQFQLLYRHHAVLQKRKFRRKMISTIRGKTENEEVLSLKKILMKTY